MASKYATSGAWRNVADAEKSLESSPTFSSTAESALADWRDPENKENPENWSMAMKVLHTFVPCCLAFNYTFATSITVPATLLFVQEFEVSRTYSILPLTLYTLGIAFGPLFIAPLSEAVGRKWIFISTHSLFILFILGAALTPTLAGLLACRFLAGFFGTAGIAVGAGTVSEIWLSHKASGLAGLLFILGPFLGPTLGPLAGAYVLHNHGNNWRWTQYTILILSAPILVGLICMRETHEATIKRGAKKYPPREVLHMLRAAVIRPARMLCTEPIVASLTIYTSYAYAMIFSFFASVYYVLPVYYGFNSRQVGLALLAVIVGYLLAAVVFAIFDKTLYAAAAAKASDGVAAPEHRLYSALVGSVMIPVSLFWFAWEARRDGNWAALVTAGIPLGFGAFSLFLSAILYKVDVYKQGAAASAIAANGMLRYTLGAVFPLFTIQMYERLGVQWAASTFAFLSLALLPIPWLLLKYGPALRERVGQY